MNGTLFLQKRTQTERIAATIFAALLLLSGQHLSAKERKSSQIPPSAHITERDVIAFAENFPAISEELHSYNYIDENMSLDDIARVIGEDEMERVLQKYGISAPERVKKINMMTLCYAKLKVEKELSDAPFFLRSSLRKRLQKEFSGNINPDDEQVVKNNFSYIDERLSAFFNEEN